MPSAVAGELAGDAFYHYVAKVTQEEVLYYYVSQLPKHGWTVDPILPNDKGGYIIYRKSSLDFIYFYQVADLTDILIWLSPESSMRNH